MKRFVLVALLLSACTESAPARPCEEEARRLDEVTANLRKATGWADAAAARGEHSKEAEAAYSAMAEAIFAQGAAMKALEACHDREAP